METVCSCNTYFKLSNKTNSWNGGLFGFEGSIVAVLFLIPATVLIYFIFRNRKTEEFIEIEPEVEPVEIGA